MLIYPSISKLKHTVMHVNCTCIASGCVLLFCRTDRCNPPLLARFERPWSDLQQHAERQRERSGIWRRSRAALNAELTHWAEYKHIKVQSSQLQINKRSNLKNQRIKAWFRQWSAGESWSSTATVRVSKGWAAPNKSRGGKQFIERQKERSVWMRCSHRDTYY